MQVTTNDNEDRRAPVPDSPLPYMFCFMSVRCFIGWTDLARDRYQWQACVNAVMNYRVP
jgi:hypothetical protein